MRYRIEGTIVDYLLFDRVDQITLSLPEGVTFRLPTESSQSISDRFELCLNASSAADAQIRAQRHLNTILNLMAFKLNALVQGFAIERVEEVGGSTATVSQVLNCYACVATPVTDHAATEFTGWARALLRKRWSFTVQTVLSLYREAKTTSDPVHRFWNYYLVLQMLLAQGRSERTTIDRHIKRYHPHVKTVRNDGDPASGRRPETTTIITAIRDAFSHEGARFNGRPLDLNTELSTTLPVLDAIVRDAISASL